MDDYRVFQDETAFGHLYDLIISRPLRDGCDKLVAVVGFTSAAFLRQLLAENEGVAVDVLIGMANALGVSESDHELYKEMAAHFSNRFKGLYYTDAHGVHAKAYAWLSGARPVRAYLGSANLSWSGLKRTLEIVAPTTPSNVLELFESLAGQAVNVTSPEAPERIRLIRAEPKTSRVVAASHGGSEFVGPQRKDLEEVHLSLLTATGRIHQKSGLNWGQREGRDPDQAYIPVHVAKVERHPDFFPSRGRRFAVETDDGKRFICVRAQAGAKAIETPEDNSLLGRYFRRRLHLPSGARVDLEDLEQYGRTDVTFKKIDEDLFLMDFSTQSHTEQES